ncbi:MAG: phosphate/phosphite/phosphonate ABC transporter substrate-binding protein [Candidatus Rifleibacteriota bacterium]
MNKTVKPFRLKYMVVICFLMAAMSCFAAENPDFPSNDSNEVHEDYFSDDSSAGYYDSEANYGDFSSGESYYDEGSSGESSGYYDDQGSYDYESQGYESYGEEEVEPQPAPEPEKPKIEPLPPIKLEEKSVRVGRIPYMSIREMMKKAVPLLRTLKKKTGTKEVRLFSSGTSYASIIEALSRGNLDFAWVGPTAYIKHRDEKNLMAIAKAKFGKETSYRGVFIAPAKGRVQGLEDLQGSSVGFVDPESASGFIYPMYLLKSLKIKVNSKTSRFLKSHDNVLQAVLNGKVDAGVCLEQTLKSSTVKDLDKKIIILAKTEEIPSDVIICRQDCPINLRESFQQALIGIKEGDLPAGSQTFLSASDEEFSEVEAIMKAVGALKK